MTITDSDWWIQFGAVLGVDAHFAGLPLTRSTTENAKLDVVKAELILPAAEGTAENGVVFLRVKTRAGHVLELDMELEAGCVLDATSDYDVVDGELVEHDFGHPMTDPKEIDRYFGRQAS